MIFGYTQADFSKNLQKSFMDLSDQKEAFIMAGLIDFMHATLFDGGLRGRFIAQIKNPQKTDNDVVGWFKGEGYDINEHEVVGPPSPYPITNPRRLPF